MSAQQCVSQCVIQQPFLTQDIVLGVLVVHVRQLNLIASRPQWSVVPIYTCVGGQGLSAYRRALWFMLKKDGYNFCFVGTRNASVRNAAPVYTDFDLWHEGWSGKRTFHILRFSMRPLL